MAEKGKRSVVILENTAVTSARNIVHGVMRYAAARPDWEITVCTGHPSEREESVLIGRPDGIISGFTDEPANPIPIPYRTTTPTVFTCARPFKGMSAPFVELDMDDTAIGRTAADALLRTHVKSFGFLGLRQPMPWSKTRLDRFRRTIQKAGFKVSAFTPLRGDFVDIDTERSALADWLRSLKKPCGIFAVNDRRAAGDYLRFRAPWENTDIWDDPHLGDRAFYAEVVKPLVAKLDEVVKPLADGTLPAGEVDACFAAHAEELADFRLTLDALRAKWITRKLFGE